MTRAHVFIALLTAAALATGCAAQPKQLFTTWVDKTQLADLRQFGADEKPANAKREAVQPTFDEAASSALPAECEIGLQVYSKDKVIYSNRVCIKTSASRTVEIPGTIYLNKDPKWRVNTSRYCRPAQAEEKKEAEGVARLCIWNGRFDDRFPLSFALTAAKPKETVRQHLSLVRVLRNARTVFSWRSTEPLQLPERLVIPANVLASPEYFREPVDLGLFILPSGADEAQVAAAHEYDVKQQSLKTTLLSALERLPDALGADNPESPLANDFACFRDRIAYIDAVVRGDTNAAEDSSKKLAEESGRADSLKVAIATATAQSATKLTVVSSNSADVAKQPASIDGIVLKEGQLIGLLNSDGRQLRIVRAGHAGTPWADFGGVDTSTLAKTTTDPIIVVEQGTRGAGRMFVLKGWKGTQATGAVADVGSQMLGCKGIPQAVTDANQAVLDAIKATAGQGLSAKAGAIADKTQELGRQIGLSVSDARRGLDDAINALPSDTRDKVRHDAALISAIDDVGAQLLEAARTVATSGPEIESVVRSTVQNPDTQLRAYQSFVGALPTDDSLFTKRVPNPDAVTPEGRLNMEFRRPVQHYFALAWNAVPFPMTKGASLNTDPKIDNLIPLVDVAGWIYQTGDPILQTWGFGFGVIGTREEIKAPQPYTTAFNLGLQGNLSANFLRVGAAYMIRDADNCSQYCFANANNLRVLVGADLFKLITGKDAAVAKTPASTQADSTDENPK